MRKRMVKSITWLMFSLLSIMSVLMVTAACTLTSPDANQVDMTHPPTATLSLYSTSAVAEISTNTSLVTISSPSKPSQETSTSSPEPTTPPTPPITAVSTVISQTTFAPEGDLLMFDRHRIIKTSFPNELTIPLLTESPDWLNWNVDFSPNGKWATYWVQTEEGSELWLTPVENWMPSLLLTIPAEEYSEYELESAYFFWLVTDRYLLFQLISYPFVVKGYIVNLMTMQVENTENDLALCNILAISPITNHLSIWCATASEPEGLITYIVIEMDGSLWTSEELPNSIIKEFRRIEPMPWSIDLQFVAFTQTEGRTFLYYTKTDNYEPILLLDRRTTIYTEILFSPDNRYIAYTGDCRNDCKVIMDIEAQNIIWTNVSVPGQISGASAWSPDSHFLAVPLDGRVFIVDFLANEIVRTLNVDAKAMVWVIHEVLN